MELSVLDNKGKESSKVSFDEALLPEKQSSVPLHEVIVAIQAAKRAGSHSTKTRTEVSGSGIKPWRQKGTGRARAGSTRSPLWRHGGIIFGPKPRSYRQDITKKKKRLAFRLAFRDQLKGNRIQVVDAVSIKEPKTKHVAAIFKKWNAPTNSLLVLDKADANLTRAARNIANVKLKDVTTFNALECARARKIFITKEALEKLSSRLAESKGDKK